MSVPSDASRENVPCDLPSWVVWWIFKCWGLVYVINSTFCSTLYCTSLTVSFVLVRSYQFGRVKGGEESGDGDWLAVSLEVEELIRLVRLVRLVQTAHSWTGFGVDSTWALLAGPERNSTLNDSRGARTKLSQNYYIRLLYLRAMEQGYPGTQN